MVKGEESTAAIHRDGSCDGCGGRLHVDRDPAGMLRIACSCTEVEIAEPKVWNNV